jgi:hypothetical protein
MVSQPGSKDFSGAIRQEVDWAVFLKIHDYHLLYGQTVDVEQHIKGRQDQYPPTGPELSPDCILSRSPRAPLLAGFGN